MRAFCRYAWLLNVRELEKCLASAVVLARDSAIGVEQLSITIGDSIADVAPAAIGAPETTGAPEADADAETDPPALRNVERREQLAAALQAHRGNISAVARAGQSE